MLCSYMDLIAIEKDSIEEKLRRDEGVVQQLKSSLEQSAHNTQNLVQILESVQGRLKRLETTIIPVYKQTLEQTRMQKNVESSMIALDRVIGYHYLCDQVENKITAGPSAADLEDYLQTLEKLRDARDYFTTYCPQSVDLDEVSNLFESGCDRLIKEFRIILQKNSHPVPDSILIDLATSNELTPPEHFSVRVMSQLQAITRYLVSKGLSTDFMNVYFQIRSENLLRSLASMKDSDRSNKLLNDRKDSLHNILDQLPHRKFSKRKVAVSATGPRGTIVRTLNETSDYILPAKDEPLLGATSLMMLASVFLRLIEGEYKLMKSIIPSEHQELILDKLVEKSLANFLTEYETVYSRAKNSLTSKKEFIVVIPLFRIIKHLNGLLPGYQSIMEKSLAKSHTRIMSLTIRCGELSMRFLEEFIGEISSQPCKITAVPKDGTVHEMTSQTMSFMEQLLEHQATAGPLWAAKDPSLARIQEPGLLATKGMASCQHRVLSTLTMKLEGKATCYESMCLRNIFLLNNYHFIRKTLTRNPSMIRLLEQEMADLEDKFNELIGKQRKGYTAYAFGRLATHIQDSVAIAEGTDKLNAPLKQSIKDRFKGFNNEIDEIVRVQRSFSIPDTHLRDSMRTESVNLVVPLYHEFYRAYSKAPFTKNPEKYLKYTPDDVEKMLMSLFDSTS